MDDDCMICSIKLGDPIFNGDVMEISCKHQYHRVCITAWFIKELNDDLAQYSTEESKKYAKTYHQYCCPYCRKAVSNIIKETLVKKAVVYTSVVYTSGRCLAYTKQGKRCKKTGCYTGLCAIHKNIEKKISTVIPAVPAVEVPAVGL